MYKDTIEPCEDLFTHLNEVSWKWSTYMKMYMKYNNYFNKISFIVLMIDCTGTVFKDSFLSTDQLEMGILHHR